METNQFELVQRSITEILSESISETHQAIYSFNYENGQKPKAISFYVSAKAESNDKLITGSYFAEIGQLDFKISKSIPNLGATIDHVTASCKTIVDGFEVE
ncbi:hypothetical protein [Empedobacter sp. R132-2]|uniref:hypothetical protein n=1 Tax=Empedobacter sp. R132-2 TaxID=2746740 RepID=UPI00257532EA|nr:hypothetical protein [Empedobacter sp. R132-2]MDM1138904.1 hypothetical protein [Empedobacter sp. R132-2]